MNRKNMNYIIKGGTVIDPSGNINEKADIGICDGLITDPALITKPRIINAENLVITPGLIDIHVHLRQPGNKAAETIASGTEAAAAGGFTTIVAMPNTSPLADTPGTIEYVKRHTEREGSVKVLPAGAMTKNLEGIEMAGIGSLKKAGIVAVTDDGKCIQNHELMSHVVEYSKSFGLPVFDHSEDYILAGGGVMHEGYWSTVLGMRGISSASEELMVARNIIISRNTDWKIHIQHVSAKESIELLRQAKRKGIKITAEATPHHIALTDDNIKSFDTNFKMNPPLRSEADRLAVIEGLRDDTITVIASDHAPHTQTAKLVEFDYAPFGIIGLETEVPVCLTELYHKGFLNLYELISKWTKGPAELLDIKAGSLKEGVPADITIIDPEKEFTIDKNSFRSKSRNTPFHGYSAKGKAVATIVDGKFVYSEMPLNL